MHQVSSSSEPRERLSFKENFGFALGDTASNFFFQTFNIFLLYYYTDVFGIDAAVAGTMFLLTRLWDAVNDPIMGIIADRTKTRWGKYRPYLLWMAVKKEQKSWPEDKLRDRVWLPIKKVLNAKETADLHEALVRLRKFGLKKVVG